jgi:hypothetical protein
MKKKMMIFFIRLKEEKKDRENITQEKKPHHGFLQ